MEQNLVDFAISPEQLNYFCGRIAIVLQLRAIL
jgi:hypothetical protein